MLVFSKPWRARLMSGAAFAALALGAGSAQADGAHVIDIAPQALATALYQFGGQTGRQIMFTPEVTAAKTTAGVHSATDEQVALAELLRGTGLTFRRQDNVFVIIPEEGASDPQSGSAAGDGADGTVQALVVTAQKREENIQDVPIAMSAFTQEDLTRSQVAGGPDLMTQVPNFTFTKTNFSGYSIQIRGIGTQAVSATVDPAVAVAFNNTPFIRNRFFEQEFYDLQRVEVLRGPQGTLYGRNATAGVVNIISAKPSDHFEAKLSGDVANYSSSRLEGMINIPLVQDKAALRIAGAWTKRDGYVKNLITGQQTDGRDLWSGRITLGLTPADWFKANLIYERFSEKDDRLRSGKQLCHTDPGPATVNGTTILETGDPVFAGEAARVFWTQGCLPASLYSPDSYQVPNGFALPYGPAAGMIGAPVSVVMDPYVSATQSSDLRAIETRFEPDYEATNDTAELQLEFDLTQNLTLTSETGFNRDFIFSFEDFNRFNTTPGIFLPGNQGVDENGVVCAPQLGCSDRMAAADLSTAKSRQVSQELRISSNYEGPVNFSVGANFLRYDSEDKYYVFFNTLAPLFTRCGPNQMFYDTNEVDDNGWSWSNPNLSGVAVGLVNSAPCAFVDSNDIHNLNDEGRNYFLSKNPYRLLSYAAFGEVYWQATPDLKLTAGFRWTDDKKKAPQIPSWLLSGSSYGLPARKVIKQEWSEPTGRLAVDWKPQLSFTDQTLVYASYVRGYKAGGANPPRYVIVGVPVNHPFQTAQTDSATHPETFDPEFVNAYEIGTKNTLFGGKLTFNLNAFLYDYTGYQISQIVDRSAVNLNFDARIWGSELELDWRPMENLRLGLKGGYENTRVDDGQSAIDLMDRTAGQPGWLVRKPFPTLSTSCILPEQYAFLAVSVPVSGGGAGNEYYNGCFLYLRPDLLPFTAPNNGEGFSKDLSGNELPNAPKFTTTITADYTLPLSNDWLATLHADLYRQSEAWTRIFNTPGYDKLKAYNNVNLAAIFSNESAGWTVMAYVKNVFNKDNITGAFLNSDDTGLTTNVFLNEPRLFGLRVTKNWSGDSPLGDLFANHAPGEPYPFRVELDGDYSHFSQGHERLSPPYMVFFNSDFPRHDDAQSDLDWGSSGGAKFTYTPSHAAWNISASVRYGRARGHGEPHAKQALPEICREFVNYDFGSCVNRSTGKAVIHFGDTTIVQYNGGGIYNFYNNMATNQESHASADFMVGRDFGIGAASRGRLESSLSAGLEYADLHSSADLDLHARPDFFNPPLITIPSPPPLPTSHVHRLQVELEARREFQGAGPAVHWDGSLALAGDEEGAGRIGIDVGLGGAVLYGKQRTRNHEHLLGIYAGGYFLDTTTIIDSYDTNTVRVRDKTVTVPAANASLGLSYELGGLKVSTGYRWERYFKAIDAGLETRKTYDRQFDGPYFKVSVGFGG